INLEKATVPMKDIIAISNMISIKKLVWNNIDISAVDEIITTLIASSATSRSGVEGPSIIRTSNPITDKRTSNKEIKMNIFMKDLPPLSPFQMYFLLTRFPPLRHPHQSHGYKVSSDHQTRVRRVFRVSM